ncbi:MAG: TraR/DksA family transcriptional regulator [Bacteroidetes bacterium]|jgi:DnaK suppressor protein|nr:TraR/DksA family transcriptional regulator [Bacteroidota bacterium]MBT5530971.1 TraR/DksA family transcriptional regulator [Cytophagia bacterium]MBT3421998.1 TraR/DksA family transcriptional regulator [Bacteroidota bacterium]MBT3799934.1 TraR/DksA family transcriptional regulator [Bacteroidota bacterium]MBT3934021.1 TraR/DksA family transcriptional regulator [Bacteroidota bacterium]
MEEQKLKSRYSDQELDEFRQIINVKLQKANDELKFLQDSILNPNEHGTDDTHQANKLLDDTSFSLEKENLSRLADRQRKFISSLENALIRIENKTYGICRETGKLIAKERLRAVPHATLSIEAKQKQS